ncbi:MAG: formyltransferase family protein [bacterium]
MSCNIGWFTTGRDAEAVSLLETVYKGMKEGGIEGRIAYIFINREKGEGDFSDRIMDLSHKWQIPLICFSSSKFKPGLRKEGHESQDAKMEWRRDFHQEVLRRVRGIESDFTVLAGYMLIVSPDMCRAFNLINLHPAPPNGPAGTWQEVIWQLIRMNARESGIIIHIVTPELDKGPPITYCLYKIRGEKFTALWDEMDEKRRIMSLEEIEDLEGEENLLFKMIRREGVKRELPLLFETIRWLSCGKIRIKDKRVYLDDKECIGGVRLNEQIERIVESK